MLTEAQKRAQHNHYIKNKDKFKYYGLRLHLEKDADIVAKLEEQPSKQHYLKTLVRMDISK